MDIVEALKADYAKFPANQTYSLYAEDVFFKDPWISFKGLTFYRALIGFMTQWFKSAQMELHSIHQIDGRIDTVWTLRWIAPVPWQSKISISGRSELTLNEAGLIQSHVDYWDCSRLDVLKQLFFKAP